MESSFKTEPSINSPSSISLAQHQALINLAQRDGLLESLTQSLLNDQMPDRVGIR
jgi:hypothetical protein